MVTIRAAAARDIPLACSGLSNVREARLVDGLALVAGFSSVFRTNVTGVCLRVTASGGNFARINDIPRPVPYRIALPPEADRLTGFGLQVDFVKIVPIQDGVLAAGKLLSVRVGETNIVDVEIPSNAIVFASSQCDVVSASGTITTGICNRSALSEKALTVRRGCSRGTHITIQSTPPYIYRHWPSRPQPNSEHGRPEEISSLRNNVLWRNLMHGSSPTLAGVGLTSGGMK